MSNVQALEQDAINLATRAVSCDQRGETADAIFYYHVGISAMRIFMHYAYFVLIS